MWTDCKYKPPKPFCNCSWRGINDVSVWQKSVCKAQHFWHISDSWLNFGNGIPWILTIFKLVVNSKIASGSHPRKNRKWWNLAWCIKNDTSFIQFQVYAFCAFCNRTCLWTWISVILIANEKNCIHEILWTLRMLSLTLSQCHWMFNALHCQSTKQHVPESKTP